MRIRRAHCFAVALALFCLGSNAAAQGRLSDKDLEKLMGNLKEDAKKFSEDFKKDVSKSTIRKTSEEKTANQLAEGFPRQTEGMLRQFKSGQAVEPALGAVYLSYQRLNEFLDKVPTSAKTMESWTRVKQELETIRKAFNFSPPE